MWLDSRNAANNLDSQLFYSYSTDGGVTWAPNVAVSNSFNPLEGWPQQNKIGDYITIVSDNTGGDVAYSGHLQLQPEQGSARTGCLFRSCIAKWWPDANAHCYAYVDCYGYANSHRNYYAERYSYGYANSHRNYYAERYSYRYAKADAHAAIRAHAQTASYTGAETVENFAERRFLVIGDQFTIGLSGP